MFSMFNIWCEGLCRNAMKSKNNSCQKAWIGHMACKKNANKKWHEVALTPRASEVITITCYTHHAWHE
jgi:hypothetical protein